MVPFNELYIIVYCIHTFDNCIYITNTFYLSSGRHWCAGNIKKKDATLPKMLPVAERGVVWRTVT